MESVLRTKFSVAKSNTEADFFRVVTNWLAGTRVLKEHFGNGQEILERLVGSVDVHERKEAALVEKISREYESGKYFAFTLCSPLPGNRQVLTTRACFANLSSENENLVSLSQEKFVCNSLEEIKTRKPRLINMLIESLTGPMDGGLSLKTTPYELTSGDEQFVAEMISNNSGKNFMPLVYISRNNIGNGLPFDPKIVALSLAGLAHVLVEPEKSFSSELKNLLGNPELGCYNGAIRVYWPNVLDPRQNRFWKPEEAQTESGFRLRRDLPLEILDYITSRTRGISLGVCSYDGMLALERKAKVRRILGDLSKIQVDGAEKTKLIGLFEEELGRANDDRDYWKRQAEESQLQAELRDDENERLRTNLSQISAELGDSAHKRETMATSSDVLLILDSALERMRASMSPSYYEGLRGFLSTKEAEIKKAKAEREKAIGEIAACFKGYRTLGSTQTQILRKYGFAYTEDGSHYKIFRAGGNPDICVTVSKTSSDWRAGEAIATTFNKTFFNL